VTERLPDRLRDQLLLGMIALRDRMEVADAVNRGRAVTDSRLAATAVEAAGRRQSERFRARLVVFAALLAMFAVAWGIFDHDWFLIAFAPLWSVLLARGLPLRRKRAKLAEQENRRLLGT
jgi:hypothetical protein